MIKAAQQWNERFKQLIANNRFVLALLVLLLTGLTILVFTRISFIFTPALVILKTVLFPFVLTGVAYYLLNPFIDYLERGGVRRVYSILFLYIFILAFLTLLILIVIPLIREQIQAFAANFPRYSEQITGQIDRWMGSSLLDQVQETIDFNLNDFTSKLSESLTKVLNNTWMSIAAVVGAITEIVLTIVTVPFILFYLLKDGRKLPHYLLHFVPTAWREPTYRVLTEMNGQISSYIRGQIFVSFCIGALLYIGYLIIGLDYSLILAIFAACTAIVPYLGPAIAITPALIVAIVTSPFMLLKMVIVWTLVQLVEGKFISPQIMGKSLHIHPITIIFVILAAGRLFGVLGIILAIPGYAVLKVICTHLFRWFQARSGLYEERA